MKLTFSLMTAALALSVLAGFHSPSVLAQTAAVTADQKKTVGTIKSISGLVSLKSAEGKDKFASIGTKLLVGDVINTHKNSSAMLEFIDTTQVALRANSQFVVENYTYQAEQPIADKAEFKLVKGGLRTVTGLIGKRGNPDSFALKSETATIGIRGTDFTARICKGRECEKLAKNETEDDVVTNTSTVGAAGRVAQLTGELKAKDAKGQLRLLNKGAAVFAGDVLTTAAEGFAVISMADSTRLTVPGGSEIQVAAYRYAPESPKTSVASVQLLKGAVRAVTGAIAKAEPGNVKFFTQTATVGIRGTALDLSCTTTAPTSGAEYTLTTCTEGSSLNLEMREGTTQLTTQRGEQLVSAGQSAYVAPNVQGVIIVNQALNVLPPSPNSGPLPEQTPANFEQLSSIPLAQINDGNSDALDSNNLYVAVNDGVVVVSNGNLPPLTVTRGEGAFVRTLTNLPPLLLPAPPRVLSQDATLSAPAFRAPMCAP